MFSRPRRGVERLTIALPCYPFLLILLMADTGLSTLGRLIILNSVEGMSFRSPKEVCTPVSWFHLRFAAAEVSVPGRDRIAGKPRIKKKPRQKRGLFYSVGSGASRRLSTCRPCRPCHPCRQAWQERPSWVRAFRRWRIRWSAAGKPRKRRSAGRYGSPSWGR